MSGQSAKSIGSHMYYLKKEFYRYQKMLINKIMRKLPEDIKEEVSFKSGNICYDLLYFVIPNWDKLDFIESEIINIFSEVTQLNPEDIELIYDDCYEEMIIGIKLDSYSGE